MKRIKTPIVFQIILSQILFPVLPVPSVSAYAAAQKPSVQVNHSDHPVAQGDLPLMGWSDVPAIKTNKLSILNDTALISQGGGEKFSLPNLGGVSSDNTAWTESGSITQKLMQIPALVNTYDSKIINKMAAGMFGEAIKTTAERKLAEFGTARIQFNVDSQFRANGSAFDMLIPFYENHNSLLFTQAGWRNKDDRNTLNVGTGIRIFNSDWMYGGNVFFDHDLTGNNRRAGIGAEGGANALKFSANYYYGLTKWHNSRDIAGYNERPANGWDVITEGWLPVYPQLGGKLRYEQYYGSDVALFGTYQRQKNPYAVTLGMDWTPVPLLTLGVDHRQGKASSNDTQLNVKLNIMPGMPWAKHLDSTHVALHRSIKSNRYQLVERNNDIVLEYKKNEVITLKVPTEINGFVNESKFFYADVTTTLPLSHIKLYAPEFIADGGFLNCDKNIISVIFPPKTLNKKYQLLSVAMDSKGNSSNDVITHINVMDYPVSDLHTVKMALPDALEADGLSTSVIRLILKDGNNLPVTGMASLLKATIVQKIQPVPRKKNIQNVIANNISEVPVITDYKEVSAGVYEAIYTSGLKAENVVIVTSLYNQEVKRITINQYKKQAEEQGFSPDQYNLQELKISKDTALANGRDTVIASVKVIDPAGKPVSGVKVAWSVSGVGAIILSSITDDNGIATSELSSTRIGNATIAAVLNNITEQIDVMFLPDVSGAGINDELHVITNYALADGADPNYVQIKVTDDFNNPVMGQAVSLTVDNSATFIGGVTSVITDEKGQAIVGVTNTRAGATTVTAQLNNTVKSTVVHFVVNPSTAQIAGGDLSVTKNNAKADGIDSNMLLIKVTDLNGNPLPGHSVVLAADNGSNVAETVVTGPDGTVTIAVTSRIAGLSTITAFLNGTAYTAAITFVADSGTAQLKAIDVLKDGALADGVQSNKLIVSVSDDHDNPLANEVVSLSADNSGSLVGGLSSVTTNAEGQATFEVTNTKAGSSTVTAKINGTVKNATVNFMVNNSTAQIASGDLSVTKDNAKADGVDSNTLFIKVTDFHGNPVSGQSVVLVANNGSDVIDMVITGTDGTITVPVTSKVAGESSVVASVNGAESTVKMTFVADSSTAQLKTLNVLSDGAIADGVKNNQIQISVTDANDNPLKDKTVDLAADNNVVFAGGITSVTTDTRGIASFGVTSTRVGSSTVTATLNGRSLSAQIAFVAIPVSSLGITLDRDKAKIGDSIAATVIAKDASGKIIPDAEVMFYITDIKNRKSKVVSSGEVQLGGAGINTSSKYKTDSSGKLKIMVTDPDGTGVSRQLNVTSGTATAKVQFIFTVATSPDTALANMWGHMTDSISVGALEFMRPQLNAEVVYTYGSYNESNEVWTRPYQYQKQNICAQVPTTNELALLYKANPNGILISIHGWPKGSTYHTGDGKLWNPSNGAITSAGGDLRRLVTCLR